jgi:hexosaminidase
MQFTCEVIDGAMHCRVTADRALRGPVFVCSGMGPLRCLSGGEVVRSLGSTLEVAIPDLEPGGQHLLVLGYASGQAPANRAWLPLGPYLRHDGGTVRLPTAYTGPGPVRWPEAGALDGLGLIPPPTRWSPAGGHRKVERFNSTHPALSAVDALAGRTGLGPFLGGETAVECLSADLPEDAYTLTIPAEGPIRIEAASYGGAFYAGITLLHLRHLHGGALPLGVIEDRPRFGWRGQHLDCARHYYRPETIHRLLDLMALLKLNRFHWHFADDEGFRLQVQSCPELWQQTQFCGEGELLPALFGEGPHGGGSYSPAEVQALLAHAKALNIEVMPEIEMPAHALGLAQVYPGMRDPEDIGQERSVQGYPGNVVNPAQDETWDKLIPLAREVAGMFPMGLLHLGGDELPHGAWTGSPAAERLMAREGLATAQDLMGWTMARLSDALPGMRVAAWEEAAQGSQGGIGHDALIFSWSGQGPGLAAARAGHDVVMTPAQHAYLDMAATDSPADWGATWAGVTGLEDTLRWDPVPEAIRDIGERIVGVQGCFWGEFTTQDDQIWAMLLPRLLGISIKAWEARGQTAPETLPSLAGRYVSLLAAFRDNDLDARA